MKKLVSWLLIVSLALSVCAFAGADAPAASGLPAVGEVVEGFEVKEIRPFGLIGADLVPDRLGGIPAGVPRQRQAPSLGRREYDLRSYSTASGL